MWALILILVLIVLDIGFKIGKGNSNGNYQDTQQFQRLQCGRCGGDNIQITLTQTQHVTRGKSHEVKRSKLERAGNKAGRGIANTMTLGMYGLVAPKKGDYKEVQKSRTNIINQKVAICQQCGNSWCVR